MVFKFISTVCALAALSSFVFAFPGSPVEPQFSKALNDFSTELYQKTIESNPGNVIFSPVSIQSALTLAMFGASGSNKEEMLTGLKYPAGYTNENIAKNFETFTGIVRKSTGLKVATKVYVMNDYSVKKSFNDVAIKSFASEAQPLDFSQSAKSAKEINDWVESNTNNKIKDLISADSLGSDTRMVLVNAIYFKGAWVHPFDPKQTFKAPFHLNDQKTIEVDFMKLKEQFKYGNLEELDATAVELGYEGSAGERISDMSMIIILPKTRTGLSALEAKLKNFDLGSIATSMKSSPVIVEIPKFKIEFDIDLNEPLKKMGMPKMFSDVTGFSDLLVQNEPLSMTKIVHKAFIEVNEIGTEASGATLGLFSSRMARGPELFTANHNFIFLINKGATTLFMGRVTNLN